MGQQVSQPNLEPGAGISIESPPRRHNLNIPTQTQRRRAPVRAAKTRANGMVGVKPPIQNPYVLVFLSMDAKALYPSVTKDLASESVRQGIQTTDLKWDLDVTTLI